MSSPKPDSPTDIPPRGWWRVLRRTFSETREDGLTDWAAALTYYAVLALFPAFIALVAVLGVFGRQPETTDALLDIVRQLGSPEAADLLRDQIRGVVQDRGGAGALLGLGLIGAVWSASGYIGAFARANNSIWEVGEGRPFWRLKPVQLLITLVAVILVALVALMLVVSGPLAEAIGDAIGLGDQAVTAWEIAKWPVMLVIVIGLVALANFGSYNKTYGTLGTVIVLLVWLWITNLMLLVGAQFDAELERQRELVAGEPAEDQLRVPQRQPSD